MMTVPAAREWIENLRTVSYVVVMTAREHGILSSPTWCCPTAAWAEAGRHVRQSGRTPAEGRRPDRATGGQRGKDAFFEQLATTWRGPSCNWKGPGIPEALRGVSDGHAVPCGTARAQVDVTSLLSLTTD